MKKFSIWYVIFFAFVACINKKEETHELKKTTDKNSGYKIIDSLGLRNQYDSAKWLIYMQHFEDTITITPMFEKNDLPKYTFGEIALDLDTLNIRGDTVEYTFCYSLKNVYKCSDKFIENECTIYRVSGLISNRQLLSYSTSCNFDVNLDSLYEKTQNVKSESFREYATKNFDK